MQNASETGLKTWRELSAAEKLDIMRAVSRADSSATEVAKLVKQRFGYSISRNVVIGAAHRAGLALPGFVPGVRRKPKPKPRPERKSGLHTHRSKESRPLPKLDKTKAPKSKPVPFVETTSHTCKWPLNGQEPGPEMLCCGAPTTTKKHSGERHSYCKYHRKLAANGSSTTGRAPIVRRKVSKFSGAGRAGVMS